MEGWGKSARFRAGSATATPSNTRLKLIAQTIDFIELLKDLFQALLFTANPSGKSKDKLSYMALRAVRLKF
jgi:hypothetical protein